MSKSLFFPLGIYGLGLLMVFELEQLPSLAILLWPSIVVIILIIINGLFVMSEFAIIGVRPSQMEQLATEGNQTARHVLAVLESPDNQNRYIATAQVGITLASLGLGMYGEAQFAHFVEPYLAYLLNIASDETIIHTLGYILSVGFLTYLHVVVGEMVPKSLALSKPTEMVMWLDSFMKISQFVFHIPVMLLNHIGAVLLWLLRIPPVEGEARLHSTEELEQIISESAEEGLLNQGEEEIILNIFDFSDRQASQVMTPRRKVEAISTDLPLTDILKIVTESTHSRFPVYQGNLDHIIGILHVNDLMYYQTRPHKSSHDTRVEFDIRLLMRPAPVVPEQFPVGTLLAAFRKQRIHLAVVLDEFGGTAGIVTLEDLVEEVVGEVRDEFDKENEPYLEIAPGILEVSGRYLIEDLLDDMDLGDKEALPDVDTLGGLITTKLGRPPQVNDQVTYNETVHFTVLSVDGLAVARARVEFPAPIQATSTESEA